MSCNTKALDLTTWDMGCCQSLKAKELDDLICNLEGSLASMKQTGTKSGQWEEAEMRVTVSQDFLKKQLKIISNFVM